MKPGTLLLVVLGTIFGPVYFAYCEYVSGENAETFLLTERATRWELSDGSILRFRGGQGYRPVLLELTPEMNLYRFRFTFDIAPNGVAAKDAGNDYQVSIMQGDIGIYERSFRATGGGRDSVALDPMEILYGGGYVLLLEEVGTPQLQVKGVKLEVRTKVEKMRQWLVWSGLVMMAFGAAIFVPGLVMRSRKR